MFGRASLLTHALGLIAERLAVPVDDLEILFVANAAHVFVLRGTLSRSINMVSKAWPDAVIEPTADGGFQVTSAKMGDVTFTREYAVVRERT